MNMNQSLHDTILGVRTTSTNATAILVSTKEPAWTRMAISNVSACLVSRDIPHSSFTIITWPFLANMAMTPLIAMSGRVVCALAGPQKPDNSRHSGAVTCPAVPSSGCKRVSVLMTNIGALSMLDTKACT